VRSGDCGQASIGSEALLFVSVSIGFDRLASHLSNRLLPVALQHEFHALKKKVLNFLIPSIGEVLQHTMGYTKSEIINKLT